MKKEEFIKRSNKAHNNKYSYDKCAEEFLVKSKVEIICPKHGSFYQVADDHFRGSGCKLCSGVYKSNTEEFINKAKKIHGNRYCYSKVNYINCKDHLEIVCKIHGSFFQNASNHLLGKGCNKCSLRLTNKEFINKSNKIHNNKYNYSKVIYNGSKRYIDIICPIHGLFNQRAGNHLEGKGCSKCGLENTKWGRTRFKESVTKNGNAIVYIIKIWNDDESFYKIGITSKTTSKRFGSGNTTVLPYNYKILYEIKGSATYIWDLEKDLHRKHRDYKYTPHIDFDGKSECFNFVDINLIKNTE